MSRPYRLIWFQHFHKAGGSSVVHLARANGETWYRRHSNGMPTDESGKVLELWRMGASELSEFVDTCQKADVSFVATEWGVPQLAPLAEDPRVTLVTSLREPLVRFCSNYYFDLYWGFTSTLSMRTYAYKSGKIHAMPNYYCRMLSRYGPGQGPLAQVHLDRATAALERFEHIWLLEEPRGLTRLCRELGWRTTQAHCNRSRFDLRRELWFARSRRLHLVLRRLIRPRVPPGRRLREWFAKENAWDAALYSRARRLLKASEGEGNSMEERQ